MANSEWRVESLAFHSPFAIRHSRLTASGATETKYAFEFTPTPLIQTQFGALGSTHNIVGVSLSRPKGSFWSMSP
jgi:hypothetical protein